MSKLLYCVQIRNTEGRIGEESYIEYSDIDLFTVYVQFGVVWTGQDSARRSGFGSEVRNWLVQLVWNRIRLVCQELLHGQLLETVCKPQLNETFRNSPEGPWVNLLVRSK